MNSQNCDCYTQVSTTYYTKCRFISLTSFMVRNKLLAFTKISFFICRMDVTMPFIFESYVLFLRVKSGELICMQVSSGALYDCTGFAL